jgi:hypothetical protein
MWVKVTYTPYCFTTKLISEELTFSVLCLRGSHVSGFTSSDSKRGERKFVNWEEFYRLRRGVIEVTFRHLLREMREYKQDINQDSQGPSRIRTKRLVVKQ